MSEFQYLKARNKYEFKIFQSTINSVTLKNKFPQNLLKISYLKLSFVQLLFKFNLKKFNIDGGQSTTHSKDLIYFISSSFDKSSQLDFKPQQMRSLEKPNKR